FTPTGSDTGIIDIPTLSTTINLGPFVDACPPLNYDSSPGGIELFEYDGEGGDGLFTIVGGGQGAGTNDTIAHTPCPAKDRGSLRGNNLLGVSYRYLGALATLTVTGAGGTDTLVVGGTQNNDVFDVAASGAVALNTRLVINQIGVEQLTLLGHDGDDVFNIPGGHPFAGITVEG